MQICRPLFGCVFLYGLLSTTAVQAEVNDPPYIDLSGASAGTSTTLCGTAACGADDFVTFTVMDNNTAAGSGNINPYLRFQHTEPQGGDGILGKDYEAAYNTNARENPNGTTGLENDGTGPATCTDMFAESAGATCDFINQAKDEGNGFNFTFLISSLENVGGEYEFLLDINEPSEEGKQTLRLDELQFFVSTSDMLNDYRPDVNDTSGNPTNPASDFATAALGSTSGATSIKLWDMDYAYDDTSVGGLIMDNSAGGSAGSGDYDLSIKISKQLFDDALTSLGVTDAYVYTYFGAGLADDACSKNNAPVDCATAGAEAEAGFEEVAARFTDSFEPPPPGIPAPGTLALFGLGLTGLMLRRKW